MKRSLDIFILLIVLAVFATSCQNKKANNELTLLPPGNHRVEIVEIAQTSNYTYLLVKEEKDKIWIAVNRDEFAEGATVYYLDGLEMKGFYSKELDRTFEKIYFVSAISEAPIYANQQTVDGKTTPEKPSIEKIDVEVELPEEGVSIGQLYANAQDYAGKEVVVKGKVTKVNNSIMSRNWVHIQDGSGDADNFDLTVTTQDQVAEGQVVTFRGVVAVNKDFGMGYSYALIVEEAKIIQ